MKCPQCGYHSFEHLDSCKKCGQSLAEHKAKFKLRGFIVHGHPAATAKPATNFVKSDAIEDPADDGSIGFGFNVLEEAEDPVDDLAGRIPLVVSGQTISIDQPFSVDGETIPADAPDPMSRPGKGSEFVF
jgi:hypothetical protein